MRAGRPSLPPSLLPSLPPSFSHFFLSDTPFLKGKKKQCIKMLTFPPSLHPSLLPPRLGVLKATLRKSPVSKDVNLEYLAAQVRLERGREGGREGGRKDGSKK